MSLYKYNLKNNDMRLNLVADSINANDISWALFDLKNQIYGDMTGKIDLSCNGTNFQSCMQTLNGDSVFNVKNGSMPKLGSLEYLLTSNAYAAFSNDSTISPLLNFPKAPPSFAKSRIFCINKPRLRKIVLPSGTLNINKAISH